MVNRLAAMREAERHDCHAVLQRLLVSGFAQVIASNLTVPEPHRLLVLACGQAERRAGKAVLQEQLAERQQARLLTAEALERERAAMLAQAGPSPTEHVVPLLLMFKQAQPSTLCQAGPDKQRRLLPHESR